MKPCLDEETIRSMIGMFSEMTRYHRERAEMLEGYARELNKPGFKIANRAIIMAPKPKVDGIVIPGNTWDRE